LRSGAGALDVRRAAWADPELVRVAAVLGGSEDPPLRSSRLYDRPQNHHARTATTSSMAPAITRTRPTLVDEVCASSSSSPATPSASSTPIDARSSPAKPTAL